MSNYQIEEMKRFFGMEKNKERLIDLMKTEGEYLKFSEKQGYIYGVKIGESGGGDVMLKVAMKAGHIEILNSYTRGSQSIATA